MIDKLKKRVSPKLFDGKLLNSCDIDILIKSCNLAPTSYGIQPIRLTTVCSNGMKELLLPASYNQPQILSCSHIFVFSGFYIESDYLEYYKKLIEDTTLVSKEQSNKSMSSLNHFLTSLEDYDEYLLWSSNQAYLTLGVLISSCASLGIDCCPIEGFNSHAYGEILGLNKVGHSPIIICAVGKASIDDPRSMVPKVRIPDSDYLINSF